jgi:IPT/TIG domain/Chitobiase/beta-hexosaminidase C-terminal domain/Fibronectin type III domain
MRSPVLLLAKTLACAIVASCLAVGQVAVLTQGYDSARDGLNANESTLTLSNVSVGNFGKLFNLPVDGWVYAQPLYVPNVLVPGQGTHNVVYIATAHDSIYAYDADGLNTQALWHTSFINPASGITTEPITDNPNNSDIDSEIGIMGTPVIDSGTNTLYVIAKTNEISGQQTTHCFRLHALDITSGAERNGSPTSCIQASVPGTGSPNDGSGNVTFDALYQIQRAGLVVVGNSVYGSFASWSDTLPYHGWIMGFDKGSLQQTVVFNATPNGTEGEGGVWMGGRGLAADSNNYIYFSTGNGNFDGASNFADSYLKLNSALGVVDYFTPYNQQILDTGDLDIAAGGVVILPDSAGTAQHPHIMIGCGKNGAIYVLDRDNLGQFNSSGDTQIIQELLNVIGGTHVNPNSSQYVANCHTSPSYWQANVYFGGVKDAIKRFTFTNGQLSTSAVSQSTNVYQFPGANPAISANGSSNAILWSIENAGPFVGIRTATTAILHAYDATNLANELYNSSQLPSDAAGAPVKFSMPTVANGRVYVGTQSALAVYGLLSSMPQAATPAFSPSGGTYSGSVSVVISDASLGATIYYTTDGSTPTTSSNIYGGPLTLTGSLTLSAMAVGGGFRTSTIATANYVINGTSAISFAQVASATPQTSTSTVSVNYPGAETGGDLNVVVVGWNDTTATVQSVTDSAGNAYSLAIGPTSGTTLRQSIYYAANIKAGSNTVTVTFNQPAAFPDVRILEYRGVAAVDVTAGAIGNSATASSGAATTTVGNELIFGANMVFTANRSAGSGFTSRIITVPDSDLAEDEVTVAAGSVSATATLTSSGPWVMQMVAFSAVSGPLPSISSLSPNSGPASGGTAVTLTGTNFTAGAGVTFGGTAATNVVVVNSTTITATTPAHTAGAVTVTVANPGGQSGSLANGFSYIAAPTVTVVSPSTGPVAGGTAVTLTGTNFAAGATVTFGGTAATNVVVANGTTITATTPAHAVGAVTVTVTANTQSGSLANGFTYIAAPTVTSVSPSNGATTGGTAITITGTNFATGAGVTFGGAAATNVVVVNGTTITATTPAGSVGAVTVTVTNVGGQSGSLLNGYTYVVVPTVTVVSPSTGPVAGGTAVTLTGTNFAVGATVTFGGTAATNVVVVNGTTITATTPAHAAGAVTVTVTANTQSGSLANGFTYIAAPTVTSVSPNSGTTAGGTAVTIGGTNFATGATVTLGTAAATNVVVVNSTTITATTPAGSAGAVSVTVTNLGSQSGSLTNGYTYVVVPTVTSVTPNNGPMAGGTAVTIGGTNFAAGATVTFGTAAATNVVVVNSTTITATTPAGSAGVVTVKVTVNGQSGSLANGFTYNGTIAIGFAQVASADPQSSQATVSVSYPAAQTGGDLNVVVVGWNDTTSTVQQVKDSLGNAYTLAIGPTSGTGLRQSIYYASNILGGTNTVTVTFNQAASFPDVRILEYRGVNAVDITMGAIGNSAAASSGSATTTAANDLIFGADMVFTNTKSAGSGLTSRVITTPDSDIAEDKVVTTAGSNSATATLSSPGPWVMQMVAFTNVSGPLPTVTSVTPNNGPVAGGTAVTIGGTNFAAGATATFGTAAATNVVVVNSTTITATTPAGTAGPVMVTVSNSGGQSGGLANAFTYIAPPTVTVVSPSTGPVAGGTAVTLTGTNFAVGATVTFGGTAATNVVVVNGTTITATTPAHAAGAVTVTVTANTQSGSLANGFTYIAAPTVTSVSPNSGTTAGGTAVTIGGTNFATGATVTLGTAAATNVVVVNSTTITATTPAGSAGAVSVTVTNLGSQSGSLTNGYTYVVVPTVTSVTPNNGPMAGGTAVTIGGTNFAAGATVTFGTAAATNVVVVNSTTITATTPAGSAGVVTVKVTVNGQSGSLANGFTYTGGGPTAPGSLAAGVGPGPVVAAVQSYINSTFLTSHTTAPFDSTGGDSIVLLASSHAGVAFSPSDNFGNSWISIAGPASTAVGFDLRTQMWFVKSPIVGSGHTVTMGLSAAQPLVMSIFVVKGSNISSPIDAISLIGSDNGTQTINVVSPNIMTSSANDLLIGFVKVSAGAVFTSGAGFTPQPAASSNFLDAESGSGASPGNYNATFTLNSQQTWQSAVIAAANNPNQTTLSWTASTDTGGNISNYFVERCQGVSCTNFVQIGTTPASNTTFNDSGLAASTSYNYRARAQDSNNILGPYSTVATLVTPAPIPSLPGNLSATSISNTEVDLSWAASTEIGGTVSQYFVERCQGPGCTTFVQIGTSAGTAYADTGLISGASYTYRVLALDVAGNKSPYSNLASATTQGTLVSIQYVQGNYLTPQSPQSTVNVPYSAAQQVGDLNVVVVGWNDSTATVSSITDTAGNAYMLVVGPTVINGVESQSIYYAKNIAAAAAGANFLTVKFSTPAAYPDIRILEYSGADPVNPVDAIAASSGNSATSTASIVTTNANDLLFAANLVQSTTTGPGGGFTSRLLTAPDGDIAEDEVVASPGTYSATAPLGPAPWIMQAVAFCATAGTPNLK